MTEHSRLGASAADHPRYVDISASSDGKIFYKGRQLPVRPDKDGYLIVTFGKVTAKVHRLVIACFEGERPGVEVDHINRVRSDPAYSNLRYATVSQNRRNVGVKRTSESQIKNVRWRKDRLKWQAYKCEEGKFKSIGHYETAEEAREAANG